MDKPRKPKIPDAAKVSVSLSGDQKKALEGKQVRNLFVDGDKLVGTDFSSSAYKKHEASMKDFYEKRAKFEAEAREKKKERLVRIATKKAEKSLRKESRAKVNIEKEKTKAKEAEAKRARLEAQLAKLDKAASSKPKTEEAKSAKK